MEIDQAEATLKDIEWCIEKVSESQVCISTSAVDYKRQRKWIISKVRKDNELVAFALHAEILPGFIFLQFIRSFQCRQGHGAWLFKKIRQGQAIALGFPADSDISRFGFYCKLEPRWIGWLSQGQGSQLMFFIYSSGDIEFPIKIDDKIPGCTFEQLSKAFTAIRGSQQGPALGDLRISALKETFGAETIFN